jgi:ABC-2 type transport system permease protein
VNTLTGMLVLARLVLRRERIQLPVWLAAIAGLVGAMAAAIGSIAATQADLDELTRLYVVNPTPRLFGLASGATLGGFIMTRGGVVFAVLAAFMNTLLVVRHTRQDEDARRAEIVRAGVVGRHASLAAVLLVAFAADVLLALLVALALITNGLPATGSFAAGASVAGTGLAFAGVAATTAQLASSARAANGLAGAAVGVAYLLAGVGNMLGTADEARLRVASAWPAWLSPIGWGQQVRPYHENAWWMLTLLAGLFLALVAAAMVLAGRRDFGRGMIPERRGPATASPLLLSPLGLAWRLQRGLFLGWAAGVAIYGAVLGAVSNEVEGLFEDLERGADLITRLGGTDLILDAFFATLMGLVGTIVSIFGLQVLLRMRSEEEEGTLEVLLAASVGRTRLALSFAVIAVAGTVALLLVAGLAAGVAAGVAMGDPAGQLASLVEAALIQVPATLAIAGAVVAAFGLLPRRAAPLAWGIFAVALATGPMVGELLELPGWLRDVSPFTHTPRLPAADVSVAPIAALLSIAAVLGVAGVATFRRRDVVRAV